MIRKRSLVVGEGFIEFSQITPTSGSNFIARHVVGVLFEVLIAQPKTQFTLTAFGISLCEFKFDAVVLGGFLVRRLQTLNCTFEIALLVEIFRLGEIPLGRLRSTTAQQHSQKQQTNTINFGGTIQRRFHDQGLSLGWIAVFVFGLKKILDRAEDFFFDDL